MTGGPDASSQFCRMCGREYPLDSAFCVACGARSPSPSVLAAEDLPESLRSSPGARPASPDAEDAALEELRRRIGTGNVLTGRSGGDVLSLDEADLLSGDDGLQADADDEQE